MWRRIHRQESDGDGGIGGAGEKEGEGGQRVGSWIGDKSKNDLSKSELARTVGQYRV